MSIFFKARGTPSIGLFFIRVALGSYFLILGIQQASNLEKYISKVKDFGFLGENLSFIVGFTLPFMLIVFGALYIMGFFTPATSLVLSLITLLKVLSRGIFPSDGIPFNKELIFFVCTLTTLFGGAGVFSFDVLLERKKKPETKESEKAEKVEVVTESSEKTSDETAPGT
ncbi:MAG: DoxX family protein [Ignavibacteria bacterium]